MLGPLTVILFPFSPDSSSPSSRFSSSYSFLFLLLISNNFTGSNTYNICSQKYFVSLFQHPRTKAKLKEVLTMLQFWILVYSIFYLFI